MYTDNNLLEIFTIFITLGGLGFINYFVLARLDKISINKHNKDDKLFFLMFFSLVNYIIYLFVLFSIEKFTNVDNEYMILAISILTTLFITVVSTFTIFSFLSTAIEQLLNKMRVKSGKSSYDSLTVKQRVFNYSESKMIFVYDLKNNLIECGFSGYFSAMEDDDFELSIYPFIEKPLFTEYEEVMSYINDNEKESDIYMNVSKNVKIILIH